MSSALAEVPKAFWPEGWQTRYSTPPFRVWRCSKYLVQAFDEENGIVRLSVNRVERKGKRWRDGIPWDDLQEIKAQCGYAGRDAVEVFPRDRDLVNVANMRHLWVLPYLLSFPWRRS